MTNPTEALYAVVDPEDLDDHGGAHIRIYAGNVDPASEVDTIGYAADDDYGIATGNMTRELNTCGYRIVGTGRLDPIDNRTETFPLAVY